MHSRAAFSGERENGGKTVTGGDSTRQAIGQARGWQAKAPSAMGANPHEIGNSSDGPDGPPDRAVMAIDFAPLVLRSIGIASIVTSRLHAAARSPTFSSRPDRETNSSRETVDQRCGCAPRSVITGVRRGDASILWRRVLSPAMCGALPARLWNRLNGSIA
jgi:hypothetical protein